MEQNFYAALVLVMLGAAVASVGTFVMSWLGHTREKKEIRTAIEKLRKRYPVQRETIDQELSRVCRSVEEEIRGERRR